jgi:hypothetical protein
MAEERYNGIEDWWDDTDSEKSKYWKENLEHCPPQIGHDVPYKFIGGETYMLHQVAQKLR